MNLLLLEDNVKLNETITKRLKIKGYDIDSFIDGKDAYESISNKYHCFILDINVPNIDGIKILKRIREFSKEIPTIIISASLELDLIKESYDVGCNDYIKKPFFIEELEIKIEQLCNVVNDHIPFDKNNYFDVNSSIVFFQNQEIQLTKKERLLLNLFLTKKNQIISYQEIEDYVWEGDYVSSESIRSLIRRLRKVFDNQYIETIIDTGYIFKSD